MTTDPNVPPAEAGAKAKHRVTNWPEYDRALAERGSIAVWFDEEFLREHWRPAPSGRRGAPFEYSDLAIQALLTLKAVFHLPYRALEGFGRLLMRLMALALPVPDRTQLSRRAGALRVAIPCRASSEPRHAAVDSTGLKIHGEGEWKVFRHGAGKRRTWRKAHLAVDVGSKDAVGVEVTTEAWSDSGVFEGLIGQVEGDIEQIDGDGAYDTRAAHGWWCRHGRARCRGRRGTRAAGRWRASPSTGGRGGKRSRATTAAASPRTPCTASSNSSATAWPPACLRPRWRKSMRASPP